MKKKLKVLHEAMVLQKRLGEKTRELYELTGLEEEVVWEYIVSFIEMHEMGIPDADDEPGLRRVLGYMMCLKK